MCRHPFPPASDLAFLVSRSSRLARTLLANGRRHYLARGVRALLGDALAA